MTRDEHCKLLEDNGWVIINKWPLEIEKYEDGKLVAKAFGQAAFTIVFHLEKDNKLPEEITLEKLEKSDGFITVGKLKRLIAEYQLPDDGKVLVERVEDVYYEQHHWGVVFKKGFHWYNCNNHNEKVLSGEYDDKNKYPNMTEEVKKLYDKIDMKYSMNQYHPAWTVCKYNDDDKNLYINLHY